MEDTVITKRCSFLVRGSDIGLIMYLNTSTTNDILKLEIKEESNAAYDFSLFFPISSPFDIPISLPSLWWFCSPWAAVSVVSLASLWTHSSACR